MSMSSGTQLDRLEAHRCRNHSFMWGSIGGHIQDAWFPVRKAAQALSPESLRDVQDDGLGGSSTSSGFFVGLLEILATAWDHGVLKLPPLWCGYRACSGSSYCTFLGIRMCMTPTSCITQHTLHKRCVYISEYIFRLYIHTHADIRHRAESFVAAEYKQAHFH